MVTDPQYLDTAVCKTQTPIAYLAVTICNNDIVISNSHSRRQLQVHRLLCELAVTCLQQPHHDKQQPLAAAAATTDAIMCIGSHHLQQP